MKKIQVFETCVSELSRLPGVGRKTAMRLALHILKMKEADVKRLSESLTTLKEKMVFCSICGSLSERETCEICRDEYRSREKICVVEEAREVIVLESAGCFDGLYHVLGGKISPLDGVGPDDLNIDKLVDRVEKEGIKEIIIATNPDVEGETTAIYLMRIFRDNPEVSITRIASGIPIGTNLEHADEVTLLKAMEGRRPL